MSDLQTLYAIMASSPIDRPTNSLTQRTTAQGTFQQRLQQLPQPLHQKLNNLVKKGHGLQQMLLSTNPSPQSPYLDPSILSKLYHDDSTGTHSYDFEQLINVLRTIGQAPSFAHDSPRGVNHVISHEHDFPSRGVAATARYMQVINPIDGVIIAYDNNSAQEAIRNATCSADQCPEVKFWSDVAFLQWKIIAGSSANLRYVLRFAVQNEDTCAVIRTVCGVAEDDLPEWPGLIYDGGSEEGKALLGTPNGSGVARLLGQHRAHFGRKIVDKVSVFGVDQEPMVLFHILDM